MSAEQWVVAVAGAPIYYGPFGDQDTAHDFARFLTREVDPAYVHRLHAPTRELLAWYQAGRATAEEACRPKARDGGRP